MIVIDLISDKPGHKFAPYQRMANAIIYQTIKNGACLPQDLLSLGFTKQDTLDLWHMSQAMASIELKLMEGESLPGFKLEKRCG